MIRAVVVIRRPEEVSKNGVDIAKATAASEFARGQIHRSENNGGWIRGRK